jgi:hypothetical protein
MVLLAGKSPGSASQEEFPDFVGNLSWQKKRLAFRGLEPRTRRVQPAAIDSDIQRSMVFGWLECMERRRGRNANRPARRQ